VRSRRRGSRPPDDVRILAQHRAEHAGEGEALLLVHLDLVDALQAIFDGFSSVTMLRATECSSRMSA
jgi:hypothetical protein